jgi:hypothetical protein
VDDRQLRIFDPGALLIGVWFTVVGVLTMVVGADSTTDALPLLFPLTLVLVGIGVLLPTRTRPVAPAVAAAEPPEPAPEIPDEYFA